MAKKVVFDGSTGKLRVLRDFHDEENIVVADIDIVREMAASGFFGGRFVAPREKDKLEIYPASNNEEKVLVKTMHISCQSDTYKPGHNYGGVIIYQYDSKSEWRTANNTRCKSGYIVIQDTDSENVKKWMSKEPGVVHGAVYRNAFDESVKKAEVVGEGFAIRKGKFAMCSGVFNNPHGSAFHDDRREMHQLSEHCVRALEDCRSFVCFLVRTTEKF